MVAGAYISERLGCCIKDRTFSAFVISAKETASRPNAVGLQGTKPTLEDLPLTGVLSHRGHHQEELRASNSQVSCLVPLRRQSQRFGEQPLMCKPGCKEPPFLQPKGRL